MSFGIQIPGPFGWLLTMADSGIPDKLSTAIRVAVFWISLPFIGLLLGGEDIRGGSYYWAAGWFGCALLSIFVAVYWDRFIPRRWRPRPASALTYLRDEDSELGGAIRDMVWRSAWGKWFTAQSLANSGPTPVNEQYIMGTATRQVLDTLTNGQLEVRGRRPGQMDYESIPQTHWRSTALHMIPDSCSLWKMILIPRGGVEIQPDGNVIGSDPESVARTDELAAYDSLIVKARQFEKLWPRKDKDTDAARKALLKKAKKAGANPAEIVKLSQD